MITQIDDVANNDGARETTAGIKPERLEFDVIGVVADMGPDTVPGVFAAGGMPAVDSSIVPPAW